MEYAAKAVETSGTAVGVRCKDGVVLGFEKLIISKMLVEVHIHSCNYLLAKH